MDKNIFRPVGSKETDTVKHLFEDSSSKLYHFNGMNEEKENSATGSGHIDSEDETEGRLETYETIAEGDDSMCTPPELLR